MFVFKKSKCQRWKREGRDPGCDEGCLRERHQRPLQGPPEGARHGSKAARVSSQKEVCVSYSVVIVRVYKTVTTLENNRHRSLSAAQATSPPSTNSAFLSNKPQTSRKLNTLFPDLRTKVYGCGI